LDGAVRLDVYVTPSELPAGGAAGCVVAVIDVLRASTTITVALANGARAVIPFDETDEAAERAKQFERGSALLAGERKMVRIPSFDLGNSPAEFTRDVVEGKTVLITTTNGTRALLAPQGALDIVVASYVNCGAVSTMLRTALRAGTPVAIVCAGRERHFSLEDVACAGRLVRTVTAGFDDLHPVLNDGALTALLLDREYPEPGVVFDASSHGRSLAEAGFAGDLALCARVDAYPIVPILADRQIVPLGPTLTR
jgi:2-phosphosulfolactate phosphatase